MKKFSFFAVALLAALCIAALAPAKKAEAKDLTTPDNGLTYEIADGVLTIKWDGVGTGEMPAFSTGSSNRAPWYGDSSITKVVVEEGVVNLGAYSFNQVYNLAEIVIPSTVKTIGKGQFSGTVCLTRVVLPEGLESMSTLGSANALTDLYFMGAPVTVNLSTAIGGGSGACTVHYTEKYKDAWEAIIVEGKATTITSDSATAGMTASLFDPSVLAGDITDLFVALAAVSVCGAALAVKGLKKKEF